MKVKNGVLDRNPFYVLFFVLFSFGRLRLRWGGPLTSPKPSFFGFGVFCYLYFQKMNICLHFQRFLVSFRVAALLCKTKIPTQKEAEFCFMVFFAEVSVKKTFFRNPSLLSFCILHFPFKYPYLFFSFLRHPFQKPRCLCLLFTYFFFWLVATFLLLTFESPS